MAVANTNDFLAAAKQKVTLIKTASKTTVAAIPFTVFDLAGNPGAGTLSPGNTANGVKPDDSTSGYPTINAFGGSAVGYLAGVEFNSPVAATAFLYDKLFVVGQIAFTGATTTLSSQPAISSRCPDYAGGSTFGVGNQIWVEVTVAFVTGNNWQVQVTYTNSAGTTGHTSIISAAQAAAALTQGKCFQLALQAGDNGVQKIESVIVTNGTTAMTAGNFNVMILRPLWSGRVGVANGNVKDDLFKTGMPVLYADSALYPLIAADSTSSSTPSFLIDVINN